MTKLYRPATLLLLWLLAPQVSAHDAALHKTAPAEAMVISGEESLVLPGYPIKGAQGLSGTLRSLLPAEAPVILRFTYTGSESLCDITNAVLLAAYDAASFQRAVREGIGADGRTLDRVMPRFEVDEAAMSALVSYLESVQALDRVGISDTAVTLHAGTDPEERAGYAVGADWFNGQGGAFGRKLLLAETGPAAIEQEDLLQRLPGPFAEPDRGDALVATPPTGLSETGKTAFYRAVVLGEAMIECGANVTRSCLTDVLERVGAAGTP